MSLGFSVSSSGPDTEAIPKHSRRRGLQMSLHMPASKSLVLQSEEFASQCQ